MTAANPSPGSSQWHRALVEEFHALRPSLAEATRQLEDFLQHLADRCAKGARVHVRTKSLLSFAEKIVRGGNASRHPLPLDMGKGLTDLIGGQIVTYSRRDMEAACALLQALGAPHGGTAALTIDPVASVDTITRLRPQEFGYTARHFIVRFGVDTAFDVDVSALEAVGHRVEIQISHALAHAWNVVTHDRTYKSDLLLPSELLRQVAEAKAMLDAAERQMEAAVIELDRYRRKHAGRLWAQDRGEWRRAKLVSDSVRRVLQDGGKGAEYEEAVAIRAELAAAAGRWRVVVKLLTPLVGSYPGIRVRLAEAQLVLGDKVSAERLLRDVLNEDPRQASAALMLCKACFGDDRHGEALQVIQPAFHDEPREPELLSTAVTLRLLVDRDTRGLRELRGAFTLADAECRKRYQLGSDVPACLGQQFRLAILAGDAFAAIEIGCLAYLNHWSVEARRDERAVLDKLWHVFDPAPGKGAAGHEGFLVALECARALLLLFEAADVPGIPRVTTAWPRPILWLAGGCEPAFTAPLDQRRPLLRQAFGRFRGTLLGGGTTAGISGLVGELAEAGQKEQRAVVAVGYCPPADQVSKAGHALDTRYSRFVSVSPRAGGEPLFSPLGPIQTWRELLAAGVAPQSVRLLGLNGGALAGVEYRLALAMGATVGLLEDSGRAVAELLQDPAWNGWPGLARLFDDAEVLEMFVNAGAEPRDGIRLDDAVVEALAHLSHNEYRDNNRNKPEYVHPSMLLWDGTGAKLDPVYRASNLLQQRALGWILATQGFAIVAASDPRPSIELGRPDPATPSRQECKPEYEARVTAMARLEHARWTEERLCLGWRRGSERSLVKRTSPYLVPYDALPTDVQRYDVDPFLKLPQRLRDVCKGAFKLVDLR